MMSMDDRKRHADYGHNTTPYINQTWFKEEAQYLIGRLDPLLKIVEKLCVFKNRNQILQTLEPRLKEFRSDDIFYVGQEVETGEREEHYSWELVFDEKLGKEIRKSSPRTLGRKLYMAKWFIGPLTKRQLFEFFNLPFNEETILIDKALDKIRDKSKDEVIKEQKKELSLYKLENLTFKFLFQLVISFLKFKLKGIL